MDLILKIALTAPPVLLAITLHEVAHGWTARYLGDPTAAQMGRLSLNPLKHIDPLGTIAVPAILLALGGMLFGWAKPVPVNMRRLNDPKRDMALVAAAGPASNLVMAILWALLIKIGVSADSDTIRLVLVEMGKVGVIINLLLMVLNLIPVPPLDGGRVLAGVLPDRLSAALAKVEPYGMIAVFGLLMMGVLPTLLQGPLAFFQTFISKLVGI